MEYVHGANLSFQYEGQVESLLEKADFRIDDSSRIGLVGDNGSGKTTLLDIIRGVLKVSGGVLDIRQGITIGFLPQEVRLEGGVAVRDYLWQTQVDLFRLRKRLDAVELSSPEYAGIISRYYDSGGDEFEAQIEKALAGFDIAEDKLGQAVSKLSGGEKTKVALAGILLQRPEMMLLDKPTNHIELSAREAFEEALEEFGGTVILASHDRYLLDRITTEILDLDRNRFYGGSYSDYSP